MKYSASNFADFLMLYKRVTQRCRIALLKLETKTTYQINTLTH